jgi:hypothetical protein
MKKFILAAIFSFTSLIGFAQVNSDSLAYQAERTKINAMLARRKEKFGQYDESLHLRTGIFGLRTKGDIQRSNDILMDIVKTDDSIYRQLKILFEYRVFQQTQIQKHTKQAEDSKLGFMTTINKLRKQADLLKADNKKQQQHYRRMQKIFIVALIVMGALILLLLRRKRSRWS